jgi:hypothetical protein
VRVWKEWSWESMTVAGQARVFNLHAKNSEQQWKVFKVIVLKYKILKKNFILFICAYNVWVISPPFPHPFP